MPDADALKGTDGLIPRSGPVVAVADADARSPAPSDIDRDHELPVVARLIVEVRSDGRRTIARGRVEDLITGARTDIAARGDSPAELLASLWRSVTGIAALARRAARALAPRRES